MLYGTETKIMEKFGLETDDFVNDEMRELFDTMPHLRSELAKKVIAPHKLNDFERDMYDFDTKSKLAIHQIDVLIKLLGVKDECEEYWTLFSNLSECLNDY